MLAKDNAEYDATGMLNTYPRCVLEGKPCLHSTLTGVLAIVRGYHSVRQQARFPRTPSAGEQMWMPTFFLNVVNVILI